ncbi:MAG: glycosyltransferase family 4 protein, partial [Ktedonobacteraceae bacterium]
TSTSDEEISSKHVCVPITAFPVAGGMRGVLTNVARVMNDQWQMTYLTHHKDHEALDLNIEIFGPKGRAPNQFPNIWLYSLMGGWKLFLLLRKCPDYAFLLPQDGVFTGAFTALLGRMAGIRVICMDHGNVTWLDNFAYRQEQMRNLRTRAWLRRLLDRVRYVLYWPSLHALIRLSAHLTDHFLVVGDEVAEVYTQRLGVPTSKISRYVYAVDTHRFCPPNHEVFVEMRGKQGIPEDAIVITLINRLTPEKGLSFALEWIATALAELGPDVRSRVRVLIAGNGPLRAQIEEDIQDYGMGDACILWGEARPADVALLLSISNIFLYSGTRGTNYSMAVLEAMAADCAVIATTAPQSNERLLADGRGIAVKPGNAAEIGAALVHLCNDAVLCRQMGQSAREYICTYHTDARLKRDILRASYFAPPLAATGVKKSEESA